jgi:hypothetical protein
MTRSRRFASGAVAVLGVLAVGALAGCAGDAAPAAPSAAQPAATAVSTPEPAAPSATSAPSAAETAAGVQATAVSQAAAGRVQVSAAAVASYRVKVAIGLQSYANALGALQQADRRAGEQATLIADAEWRSRARTALRQMESAADLMTGVTPIPPEMALTDALIREIDDETRVLSRDFGLGMDLASPAAITAAGQRTAAVSALLARANIELRRGAA